MRTLQFLLGMLLLLPAGILEAQVFQWTDSRGVIHFTDNLHSVPESVRKSSHVVTRREPDIGGNLSEIPVSTEVAQPEPAPEAKAPEALGPQGAEAAKVPQQVIHYNPQHTTIVVVNSVVRHPRRSPCERSAQGCPRSGFQASFDDRRYIHPSVFDGGPRQYIHPELFPRQSR